MRQLALVMFLGTLLSGVVALLVNVATGSQLVSWGHPVWPLLAVSLGLSGAVALWQARSHGHDDRLDDAARVLAGRQRGSVTSWWNRARIDLGRPLVTWRQDGGQARELDEFLDWFTDALRAAPRQAVPRAVVLGHAGSGKTTLATLLVGRLLAQNDVTWVPVLFNLASWGPTKMPLRNWLAQRLREDHPALSAFGRDAPERLLQHRVVAVLDGLDEVRDDVRGAALARIDEWLRANRATTPMVLTCRTEEFPDLDPTGSVLPDVPVVELQPVTVETALAYLGDRAHWAPVRRRIAQEGPVGPLAAALSKPLMLYLARRVAEGTPELPERLADSAAHPRQDDIEGMLLDKFVPAVFQDDAQSSRGGRLRWEARKAQRWLGFLAGRGRAELGWRQLGDLASGRWPILPVALGIVTGVVAGQGALLVGMPTGLWWGLCAGTGFATLLWLLGRGAAETRSPLLLGVRIGVFGGLLVGLPGAFLARFVGFELATLLFGVLFGLVAGALSRRLSASGSGLLAGLVAGPVGWLVAALVCGFPQGAQVAYADRLPPGAAADALQAWRSAIGFGLAQQLWIAVAFSLAVGVTAGVVAEFARSGPGRALLSRQHTYLDGSPGRRSALVTVFVVVGMVAGLVAGGVLAGSGGAAAGVFFGAGLGSAFVLARRRSPRVHTDRLWASLDLRVRTGLAGGVLGGVVGGLALPAPYVDRGTYPFGAAVAGAADGMQAGLAFGLIGGVVFGLVPPIGRPRGPWPRPEIVVTAWVLLGALAGALMGLGLLAALGVFIDRDPDVVIATYAAAGSVLGAALALGSWVGSRSGYSPLSTLSTARTTGVGASVVVGVVVGVATSIVSTPTFGVIAAVMLAVAVLGSAPWGIFTLARIRLALARRLPWRTMQFLADSRELGVLRQAGAEYRFRHARLRERLADVSAPRRSPLAGKSARWRLPIAAGACAVVLVVGGVVCCGRNRISDRTGTSSRRRWQRGTSSTGPRSDRRPATPRLR